MRMTRVYFPQEIQINHEIYLDERTSHHLINVLRLRVGNILTVFNGNGKDYIGKISKLEKKGAVFIADAFQELTNESSLKIHLGQAISKGERMDFVIQKSVELGVSEITPIITEHCNVKLDEERRAKRLEHWQRVAIGAAEQSGRAIIPIIHFPVLLSDFLEAQRASLVKIILHYRNAQPLAHLSHPINNICLIVGPEGGITEIELASAALHGFQATSLGPRILRTETAPLAAIAILQAKFGDLI